MDSVQIGHSKTWRSKRGLQVGKEPMQKHATVQTYRFVAQVILQLQERQDVC